MYDVPYGPTVEMILKNGGTGKLFEIKNMYINYIGMTIKKIKGHSVVAQFLVSYRRCIRLFIIYLAWYVIYPERPELLFGRYIFCLWPSTNRFIFPCRVVFLRVLTGRGSGGLFSTFDKSCAFGLFIYFIMYTNVIAKTWLGFFLCRCYNTFVVYHNIPYHSNYYYSIHIKSTHHELKKLT